MMVEYRFVCSDRGKQTQESRGPQRRSSVGAVVGNAGRIRPISTVAQVEAWQYVAAA